MIVNGVLRFPQEFKFGSAVSPFQVEGNSGIRKTDWDDFLEKNPGMVKPNEIGPQWWLKGKAEGDIETMSGLGLKIQRIGIEWARIEPHKGEINHEAIQRYKEIISKIIELDMIPVVTLNHFTLPQWIAKQESWLNDNTVGYFSHYAKFIVSLFPEVTYWITINEPNTVVASGYLSHFYPPQSNSLFKAIFAGKNMLAAHRKAYSKIKKVSPLAKVGVSYAFRWSRAFSRKDILERFYANIVNEISEMGYVRGTPDKLDFIGCNYYTGYFLDLNIFKWNLRSKRGYDEIPDELLFGEKKTPNAYVSDFSWPIVPSFFLDVLRKIHNASRKPIIVTENGIADSSDDKRAYYILTHLAALWRALQEGIRIEHYLHWSTIDNIEWTEGYRKSFGLIELDPVTGKRNLRKSAMLYKEIVESHELDVEKLISKYLEDRQQEVARKTIQNLMLGKVRLVTPEGEEKYS